MIQDAVPFQERASVSASMESRTVSELIGMSRLLFFAGKITEKQRKFLLQWEKEHTRGVHCWPLPEFRDVLYRGDVEELYRFLSDMVVSHDAKQEKESPLPSDATIENIFTTPVPDIVFQGCSFCFTGKFDGLSRNDCEYVTEYLGGSLAKASFGLNYLIVAGTANPHWAQQNFGRKIQTVMKNNSREECQYEPQLKTKIISESDWRAAVEKVSGQSLPEVLASALPYRPANHSERVTVDWENHARRVLEDVFGGLPPMVEYEQGKTLFKIFHPCKPKEVILKLRYGSYGITRLTGADGDELYEVGSGYCAGKKILEKYRKMLWGEI